MTTVKVTDLAHQEAAKMLSIINSELPGLIGKLNGHGQQLSEPNNWDGPLAQQFRGQVWPQAKGDLDKMKASLEHLQQQVQKILTNISQAGGA
ncbi:pyrophosphorylase [Streptomyces palmae]|uniref:Pyrophosphorylase n=1 Tax=Streptomyces palmae TaxID=1701085 RepID=A0A4Z0GFT9_9ACTN|nr:pyrophosphorylase [Streptomyces palmae]TGA95179.1 pyrophosphorylase [Streptomyces palmae]